MKKSAGFNYLVLFLLIVLLVAALPGCKNLRNKLNERKNILLIIIDTQRADHLGCYGYNRKTTPNIDAFAASSTVFENAYSHSPWTTPSIASIMTSLEPVDHGISGWKDPLLKKHLTLAEHLRVNGYFTAAAIGHTIVVPKYGFGQGFNVYDTGALDIGYPLDIKSSDYITDFGIKMLDQPMKEPFFLWLHYFDPHRKYLSHKEFKFGGKALDRYNGETAFTDFHIGRLLNHLKKRGMYKDTIVAIIADHGEEFLEHGGVLHGLKIYNEVVRVPLIIRVPGFLPGRVSKIVAETDLAPTLLKLVGVPLPEQFKGHAINYGWKGFQPQFNRTVFFETYFMDDACKHGVLKGNWKLIHDCDHETMELYNLKADPREKNNLDKLRNKQFEKMKKLLEMRYPQGGSKPEKKELSPELQNHLKSLGYM